MIQCGPASRNKVPILEVLKKLTNLLCKPAINVVEVASGTGEHAAYFASEIPSLKIQPTDPQKEVMESISAWNVSNTNVFPPLNIPVENMSKEKLPQCMNNNNVDIVLCINMIHITPFRCTRELFRNSSSILNNNSSGYVLLYGPYRVNGFLVESNIEFDKSLKERNEEWGIRDLEEVQQIASEEGNFVLFEKVDMPANNLCVIFKKHD